MRNYTSAGLASAFLMSCLLFSCEDNKQEEVATCEEWAERLVECGIVDGEPEDHVDSCEDEDPNGLSTPIACQRHCDWDTTCEEWECCRDECSGGSC